MDANTAFGVVLIVVIPVVVAAIGYFLARSNLE